jgi:hypothetical protein
LWTSSISGAESATTAAAPHLSEAVDTLPLAIWNTRPSGAALSRFGNATRASAVLPKASSIESTVLLVGGVRILEIGLGSLLGMANVFCCGTAAERWCP